MKQAFFFILVQYLALFANAQSPSDSILIPALAPPDSIVEKATGGEAEDPNNFLTRIEFFNNLKHFERDFYVNVTTLRTIIQFNKRFTTRLDFPLAYNSFAPESSYKHYGLGDISIRLLGYKLVEKKGSVLATSLEFSFNTASSPLLGAGKNLIIPVISYSKTIKKIRGVFFAGVQQTNSMWGDKEREKINYSKVQLILITPLTKKFWTVISPELYLDYVNHAEVSMNLQARLGFAPVKLINIWVQASTGLFGDFVGRYQWSTELGFRYFIFRKKMLEQIKD